jgi:hypothetical protein
MQQIGWVKPASLIQYLNSGVEVNGLGQYPGYPQHPITPLMAIIRSPSLTYSWTKVQTLVCVMPKGSPLMHTQSTLNGMTL